MIKKAFYSPESIFKMFINATTINDTTNKPTKQTNTVRIRPRVVRG